MQRTGAAEAAVARAEYIAEMSRKEAALSLIEFSQQDFMRDTRAQTCPQDHLKDFETQAACCPYKHNKQLRM